MAKRTDIEVMGFPNIAVRADVRLIDLAFAEDNTRGARPDFTRAANPFTCMTPAEARLLAQGLKRAIKAAEGKA